jgi:triphosphoribosyl-dephospho-CoA synthase
MNAAVNFPDQFSGEKQQRLADAIRLACVLEIRALKPGNVGLHGEGHGMHAEHFIRSADAIALPITAPDRSVGERILAAIQATQQAVACNTNLGIVLLCAPLMQAAWLSKAATNLQHIDLIENLKLVLHSLDRNDADLAYQAIVLANPGGLGKAERHDVHQRPSISLLQAMQEAAGRDAIAHQYATDYAQVFAIGVAALEQAAARGWSEPWAATACYLAWLRQVPDTHVTRKFGLAAAQQLQQEALVYGDALAQADDPQAMTARLMEWDGQLKQRGINPGTSADLTVASILARSLQEGIQQ